MSSQPPTVADRSPLRPLFSAEAGRAYSLDLLKAYSGLHERLDVDGRPEPPPAPSEVRSADPAPPQVTADSSGSPHKPAVSKDDSKAASCDSTDQLSERCSSPLPPASKLTKCDAVVADGGLPGGGGGGGGGGGALDPGIRRYRTAFRPDQIKRLEAEFLKDNYVSRPKRNELANELGLAEGTIKVWFQNRRMKHKRQQMTAWPLDPRFADPALAALLLQAAVASGGYPYGGVAGLAAAAPPPPPPPPLSPYYGPLAASKCRFSPYSALPVRPQPSLAAGFLLPPPPPPPSLHASLLPAADAPLSPPSALSPTAPLPLAVTSSSEQSGFFRPFKSDSPPPGDR